MTAFNRRQNFSRTVLGGSLTTLRQHEEREALLKLLRLITTIAVALVAVWVATMVIYVFAKYLGYEFDPHAPIFWPLHVVFGR